MEFQDVVRRRRMVRRFTDEAVAPEAVDRLVRNAVRAPSAGFAQGWSFLVLTEPDDVARFWAATSPEQPERSMSAWLAGMRTAPVLVVVLTSKDVYLDRYAEDDKGWADRDESRWAVPYWHVDAGMAALLMLQTAVDEGLGACFFGVAPGEVARLRAAFGVPDAYAPTGVVAVGHPADRATTGSPRRRARKPLDDVVHRGRWADRS
ncbi:nitroreductase family protein [Cellulosimicrobium sp. BIT-GX5]|uniref:Nitroreductase family protein n=1 Tax=Cellulosimicrobium composti TaxID=2672572 RepID=A0A6N7ZHF9_9MICO|nr:nitroreductase family protein [Cellulosimicrobium composti]MTG88720.1 nitroreductase family protein [Cellulosimicrobium composti]